MNKSFKGFWYALAILQLLTGGLHALSFLAKPQATNATEQQLIDLMTTYQQDMGAGFHPTMFDLFTALSSCFTLVCLLGGWLNLYLLRQQVTLPTLRGVAFINAIVFGVCFVVMAMLTFLPPVVLTGLIFGLAVVCWLLAGRNRV